jgi:hypothetical protein
MLSRIKFRHSSVIDQTFIGVLSEFVLRLICFLQSNSNFWSMTEICLNFITIYETPSIGGTMFIGHIGCGGTAILCILHREKKEFCSSYSSSTNVTQPPTWL